MILSMGISIFKVKKWANMLAGKSIYHVNQGVGRVYSIEKVEGYYNDLTEKVTRGEELPPGEVPMTIVDSGDQIHFPIAIFQYGLGAYDLYLLNQDPQMLEKMRVCADWAVDNQEQSGGWNTFSFENEDHPYSSMAQGEGISLLLRAYKTTKGEQYLQSAKRAVEFMLLPISEGGTTEYKGKDVYFYECTHDPLILNGWIFSLWGLFDYLKIVDNTEIKNIYRRSIQTVINTLSEFELGYWSKYELGRRIASPFYHKLHIAQFNVMHDITREERFFEYAVKWQKYEKNILCKNLAFSKKVIQKICE